MTLQECVQRPEAMAMGVPLLDQAMANISLRGRQYGGGVQVADNQPKQNQKQQQIDLVLGEIQGLVDTLKRIVSIST